MANKDVSAMFKINELNNLFFTPPENFHAFLTKDSYDIFLIKRR